LSGLQNRGIEHRIVRAGDIGENTRHKLLVTAAFLGDKRIAFRARVQIEGFITNSSRLYPPFFVGHR
jgi:hypothetical protein